MKLQTYKGRGEAKSESKLKNEVKRIFVSGCALQFGSNCFSLDQPCGDSISSALTCETVVAFSACIGITALLQSNCTNRCLPSQITGYLIRMVSHLCPTLCHIPVLVVYTDYPKMLCFSKSSDIFHFKRCKQHIDCYSKVLNAIRYECKH